MTTLSVDVPAWVASLRGEANLGLPLRWLDPGEARERRDALIEAWAQIPFDENFQALCRDRIARSVPVAAGLTRKARAGDREEELTLLFDPERPEGLVAALGERIPPIFWVPLGQTAASLREDLAPYLTDEPRSAHHFTRSLRIFKGTGEQLGLSGLEELVQAVAGFETWIDPSFWGSAEDDDPWPADPTSLSMIDLRVLLDDSRRQHPGRFEAFSFRTLWSRSILRLEAHPFQSFVFELRYEPSRHPELLRATREHLPFQLPDDIPVDLVASLLRGPSATPAGLAEALKREGPAPYLALAQCAMEPGEPTSTELLRAMMATDDLELRDIAVDLADAYAYRGLLYELLAETYDVVLRERLEERLAPPPPPEDEEGEEGEDDYDDDDYDDEDHDDDDDHADGDDEEVGP